MGFYEGMSGARFHAAYYRPGFVNTVLNPTVQKNIIAFLQNFTTTLSEMANTLNENMI